MNNIIEFKKDCIMKTYVSEITNISLTHDYKIMDDTVEGYFDVVGEYKITKSSITNEEFSYTIPFTIALSSLIDKDTINLSINDFSYDIEKDILHLKISLSMDYNEIEIKEEENIVEEYKMEGMDLKNNEEEIENKEDIIENEFHNELMDNYEKEVTIEEKKETEETINKVIDTIPDSGFNKYKVYIMREEDTLESIMIKYNVKISDIKEYNDIENLKVGDKIVIPFIENETDK